MVIRVEEIGLAEITASAKMARHTNSAVISPLFRLVVFSLV